MKIKIDNELKKICFEIIEENKTPKEWHEIRSCDMFQSEHYCGGFEDIEVGFTFSYYDSQGKEYWFGGLKLEEIKKILNGEITELSIREAE